MSKTILIPTDFTVESLNSVRLVLEDHPLESVSILLVCPVHLPESTVELLFFEPRKKVQELMSAEFKDGLAILRNRFSDQLTSLRVELFHGMNASAFSNFLEAFIVDEIVVPSSYKLKKVKNGFDLDPFIKKSQNPVREVKWEPITGGSGVPLLRMFGV